MKNKKILIILTDYLFIRNYIKTNVFKNLINKKKYDVEFLINNAIKINKKDFKEFKYTRFNYPNSTKKTFIDFFQRKIWQNVALSSSFKFKLKIYLQFNRYIDAFNEKLLEKIYKFPKRILSLLFNYLKFYFDTLKVFFIFRKYQEKKLKINSTLLKKIKDFEPNLIIFPTNTINPVKYDLYRISQKIKIKILYLVDNWDNLSSKSTLFSKNSVFTVWGKQTMKHANKIQKIKKKQIKLLGTPRFQNYFKIRNRKIKSYFNFKYILFVESTLPVESTVLPFLDKIISENKRFKNLKIIYRPHPWRKSLKVYNQKEFKNVIIDPQMKKNYSLKNFSSSFQPSLDYYPSLIKNAEIVISGPTSMIIESLIFRKPILLLNFKIKNFLLSPYNILKNFEHFKNIEKCSIIIKHNDEKNLERDLIKCLNLRKDIDKNKIDNERDYFLTEKCKNYKNNLNKIINSLLK